MLQHLKYLIQSMREACGRPVTELAGIAKAELTDEDHAAYAEFAGWAPGGKQMLVVRQAGVEGKYTRSFELMRLDTLATERRAGDPELLGAFQRWQDPAWKRLSLSLR
jgi:hypothetical protein